MELWSASSQQGAVWGCYLLKQQPELPFRLAHPLAEAVGSLPHEEGHLPVAAAALVGQRPGHQRLPRPRGAVEKTTSGDRREDLTEKCPSSLARVHMLSLSQAGSVVCGLLIIRKMTPDSNSMGKRRIHLYR